VPYAGSAASNPLLSSQHVQTPNRKHEDRREVLVQALKWFCYQADETNRNAALAGRKEQVSPVPVKHGRRQTCAKEDLNVHI
jgi:hypothetical protein